MTVEDISIDGGRAPACHHQGTAHSHSPQDPLRVVLSDSGSPHEEVEDKSNPKTKHSLSEVYSESWQNRKSTLNVFFPVGTAP